MVDNKTSESPIPSLGNELARFEGKSFYLAEHEHGILYHVYNSMDLVIRNNVRSTYEFLKYIIDTANGEYKTMDKEDKEVFESMVQGVSYILGNPLVAFIDNQFMIELTECAIKNLTRITEEALKKPLQEETKLMDEAFKNAVLSVEELKRAQQ